MGGFLFCPCHLPLTLALLGGLSAGSALGAMVSGHLVLTAVVISSIWALATWRGLWLIRAATSEG
jgi:hypothetical protein